LALWSVFFLANNSQRTRRDVVTKLHRLGIDVDEARIFTCAMATARFLAAQKPHGTAYFIGEGGPLHALHENGSSIGDTTQTDILGGVQLGCRTILVLSGGTAREDLASFAYGPDIVVDSIADLSASRLAGLDALLAG
jgi:ribonucleotide monophosphatase NagD (HAD superfamily)